MRKIFTINYLNWLSPLLFFSALAYSGDEIHNSTEFSFETQDSSISLPETTLIEPSIFLDTKATFDSSTTNRINDDSLPDLILISDSSIISDFDSARLIGADYADTTTVTDSMQLGDSTNLDSTSFEVLTDSTKVFQRKITRKKSKSSSFTGYPGISNVQDSLAKALVKDIHSFNFEQADLVAKKLQKLEKKNHLPPLSYLLLVTGKILQIHNSEYSNQSERLFLLKEIEVLSKKGLDLSASKNFPDSAKPTCLLIQGGILGFSSTLKMQSNLIEAAMDGYSALRTMEKVLQLDTTFYDAYLGLGIFYCALAKAPVMIRTAINITGRNVSLDTGLNYLRKSAYKGSYTSSLAKLYLIQFLSPYMGHLVDEKRSIFRSLQKLYPTNPFYYFLELDEAISFTPEQFVNSYNVSAIKKRFRNFNTSSYPLERYFTLIKWQLTLLDSQNNSTYSPDTTFNLKEFAFYPIFLEGIREKLTANTKSSASGRTLQLRIQKVKSLAANSLSALDESSMFTNRKSLYTWHIRDGLRLNTRTKDSSAKGSP